MSLYSIKLPDVGEGVAEAEITEWVVSVGDIVAEDDTLGAVMTDKASVEIPAPIAGTVAWLGADVGDVVAVGSEIIRLDVSASGPETAADTPVNPDRVPKQAQAAQRAKAGGAHSIEGTKVLASPAVRDRARKAGVDLSAIIGSGAKGRIRQADLSAYLSVEPSWAKAPNRPMAPPYKRPSGLDAKSEKVIGLRRKIAQQMSLSAHSIPHITYVDEVDMTALDALRKELNETRKADEPKLTFMPFLMLAMAKAIQDVPQVNAHYDDAQGKVHTFSTINIGIATQTDRGLVVPVSRDIDAKSVWDCASDVARLASAARDNALSREALTGSTITITSLGAMGGLMTTPIINHPEVAIVGVNKMQTRPVWNGTEFRPRKAMNLSSSFDHRIVDGWDAARFIQRIKELMENPVRILC